VDHGADLEQNAPRIEKRTKKSHAVLVSGSDYTLGDRRESTRHHEVQGIEKGVSAVRFVPMDNKLRVRSAA
jgi:hypothetical protein